MTVCQLQEYAGPPPYRYIKVGIAHMIVDSGGTNVAHYGRGRVFLETDDPAPFIAELERQYKERVIV